MKLLDETTKLNRIEELCQFRANKGATLYFHLTFKNKMNLVHHPDAVLPRLFPPCYLAEKIIRSILLSNKRNNLTYKSFKL